MQCIHNQIEKCFYQENRSGEITAELACETEVYRAVEELCALRLENTELTLLPKVFLL